MTTPNAVIRDSAPVYYEQHGLISPGQPLVIFFNGWCLSSRYWQETVRRLAMEQAVLVFDGRGFGRSRLARRLPGSPSAVDSAAYEASALLEHLGLHEGHSYHVVGHSLGGVTATHFAALAQQRGQLASLTVVNSGSFGPDEAQGSRLNTFVKIFVRIKRVFNLPLVRSAVVARSVALPIPPEYIRVITEDFALADEQAALDLALSSLQPRVLERYRLELQQITTRLLLVVGDRDATIPPQGMYNIKRFQPGAQLASFADCGHLPMLEQPERFAGVLAAHFSQAQPALDRVD